MNQLLAYIAGLAETIQAPTRKGQKVGAATLPATVLNKRSLA